MLWYEFLRRKNYNIFKGHSLPSLHQAAAEWNLHVPCLDALHDKLREPRIICLLSVCRDVWNNRIFNGLWWGRRASCHQCRQSQGERASGWKNDGIENALSFLIRNRILSQAQFLDVTLTSICSKFWQSQPSFFKKKSFLQKTEFIDKWVFEAWAIVKQRKRSFTCFFNTLSIFVFRDCVELTLMGCQTHTVKSPWSLSYQTR